MSMRDGYDNRDRWYPRSFYAPWVAVETKPTRLERALKALVNLADYAKHLATLPTYRGEYLKADREAREWERLYNSVLRDNAEMAKQLEAVLGQPASDDAAELVRLRAMMTDLEGELLNLQRLHTSMMQDRESTHRKWERSVEENVALSESCQRLMAEKGKRVAGW